MYQIIKDKLKVFWADKDERNLIINILIAFFVKGLSLFISVFSMPLYIGYFNNNDVLGVWYTILSVLSWITICDLGLGNGLRNHFTVAYAQKDVMLGKKYITSTYASLIMIILPVVVVMCAAIPFVDFNGFLKLPTEVVDANALAISVAILLGGVALSFVLKSVNSLIYAIQKASINNVIALATSIIPLVYILVAPAGTIAENLIRLALVHIIAINLPLLVATMVLFSTKCKDYRPHIRSFDWSVSKKMLHTGMAFFCAQLFFMAIMSTNELFITRLFSSDDVVEYSAYYRIFMTVGSLFMLALTPLWSKVTKDLAEGKYRKIKITNRVLYILAACACVAEFCLIFVLQWVFNIWLGEATFAVEMTKAFTFAFFGGIYIFNIVLTTVANGMGELRTQTVFYGVGAALKIPITILLSKLFHNWCVVVGFNCAILLLFCVFQVFWIEKRINKLINSNGMET